MTTSPCNKPTPRVKVSAFKVSGGKTQKGTGGSQGVSSLTGVPAVPLGFKLTDAERTLYDTFAQESTNIAGTDIDYFSLDQLKTTRDPLYNEPIKRKYIGPLRVRGFVQYPDDEPEANENGYRAVWSGQLWIARKDFEDAHLREPFAGDIIRIWKLPIFDRIAVNAQNEQEVVPGAGMFFDVIKVHDDGHLFDNASFVGYQMDIQRRTDDTPERRLQG